tara:strand:+ start:186 stop:500 length:315 start_codon:yes stop_codon:yes gene_type:complete
LGESAFLLGAGNAVEKRYPRKFFILFLSFISKAASVSFVFLIKAYRAALSPFLGSNCRFDPTCSEYGIQAFQKHSPTKAFFLLIKRVFRCHPLSSGGADPVPKS